MAPNPWESSLSRLADSMPANVMEAPPETLPPRARAVRALVDKLANRPALVRGEPMRDAVQVFHHFHAKMRDLRQEQFWAVLLDGKHRLIETVLVSQGTLTSSPVHPREVFVAAIKASAAAIVLVHNHPSGDPTPSGDDLDITARLSTVGDLVGIRILDHVVVGDGSYVSLADRGLVRR